MRTKLLFLSCALMALSAFTSCSRIERFKTKNRMPIQVFPFYNYKPLSVNAGIYSEELLNPSLEKMQKFASVIRQKVDSVPVEVLYILSTRLFDLGDKKEGAYWFHCANFRASVLASAFASNANNAAYDKLSALHDFDRAEGEHIFKFLSSDRDMWIAVANRSKRDCMGMRLPPSLYRDFKRNECFEIKQAVLAAADGMDVLISHVRSNY